MSTKIEVKGDYKQKVEIFGHVLSHNQGTFDITKTLGGTSWSQPVGPAILSETVDNGKVSIKVSFLGHSVTLIDHGVVGHNKFKIELDSGNLVEGTVIVSDGSGTLAEHATVTP